MPGGVRQASIFETDTAELRQVLMNIHELSLILIAVNMFTLSTVSRHKQ